MRQIIKPPAALAGNQCNRCGGPLETQTLGEAFTETFRFDFTGGYGSCFGDGTHVHGSFCQGCIEQVYGPYLRRHAEIADDKIKEGRHVLICDRCGRQMAEEGDWMEWQEALTIRFPTLSSGPGVLETDLCQHCVMHTMGAYLRITEDYALETKRRPAPKPRWVYQQPMLAEKWSKAMHPDTRDLPS